MIPPRQEEQGARLTAMRSAPGCNHGGCLPPSLAIIDRQLTAVKRIPAKKK